MLSDGLLESQNYGITHDSGSLCRFLFTLAAVTVLVCSMILFQNAMYRKENKIAKEQKKKIEELNRMQNHFFSSMSHEIRTPINTIIGLNEMILREEISDEAAGDAKSIQGQARCF